jgi:hypothetical protein
VWDLRSKKEPLGLASRTKGYTDLADLKTDQSNRSVLRYGSSWRAVISWELPLGMHLTPHDLSYEITKTLPARRSEQSRHLERSV